MSTTLKKGSKTSSCGTTPMAMRASLDILARAGAWALLRREGPYAVWLQMAEAYEAGRWEEMSTLAASVAISPFDLPDIYLESLNWARERVRWLPGSRSSVASQSTSGRVAGVSASRYSSMRCVVPSGKIGVFSSVVSFGSMSGKVVSPPGAASICVM